MKFSFILNLYVLAVKKILCGCLLTVFVFLCTKASASTVVITNTQCPDNTYLSFGRPVDNNPAHFMNAADFFLFKDGSSIKHFTWEVPVFLMITGNEYCPKQRIILCPQDSIHIQITPEGQLFFEGINSAGNNLLKDKNLLISGLLDIENEILNSNSKEEVIKTLEKKKHVLFSPMTKLYNENRISEDFYHFAQNEFEQVFCNAVYGKIYLCKSLTEKEKKEVKSYFYLKYNPFDSKYKNNYMTQTNMSSMAALMSEGFIPPREICHTGLWDKAHSYKEYLPQEYQEVIFANRLQIRRNIIGIESDAQYKSNIALLKKVSPLSIYLPILEMYNNEVHDTTNEYGVFLYDAIYGLSKLAEYPLMELQSLIKTYFQGTPVLIDMWATYCAPCKKEFLHKEKLHQWLHERKIRLLYVSVDFPNNSKKWENDVVSYGLKGYHYFITSKADKQLSSLLGSSITIPRYLLFDAKGCLLSNDLPRPSSGEKLYNTIEELLQLK